MHTSTLPLLALLLASACTDAPVPAATPPDDVSRTAPPPPDVAGDTTALHAAVRETLAADNLTVDASALHPAFVDLDGDGTDDGLVYLQDPMVCGTGGCRLLVYRGGPDGYTLDSDVALARTPITVANAVTAGWRDLVMEVSGGGMPAKTVVLRHGPNGYPANPSTLDAAGDGPFEGETVLRMDAQANDSAGAWPVDTDAAGMLPCTTGGTALDRSAFSMTCDFRVKRNPYGATIWALRPGDRRDPAALQTTDLRVLYVESDVFSTSDASEVQTQQAEDSWVVSVGERERYWIPFAVIQGG